MQTILVQGESDSDVKRIIDLARKLNLKIKVFSSYGDEGVEDKWKTGSWDDLSESQQKGLLGAITQIEDGQGIANCEVLKKHRKHYHG
jgi:hypothetical protein